MLRRGAADYVTKENLQRLGPAVVHDQLGPLLTALKLNLETAQQHKGAARAESVFGYSPEEVLGRIVHRHGGVRRGQGRRRRHLLLHAAGRGSPT